ncbi:beta-lactam-binding protein with PASTA domain [Breznakibacter xylanolyticus]|uniref:Beta-lactam-binding protein with PASTA domain n=2 Tax=Breznakibacter xylanolyticus TaxID=990 RepID=A0A2W7QFQ4_9BACT|nr:beta-lactam-binding protein with PASTA domain [Breznakibacter xylanolyticus]
MQFCGLNANLFRMKNFFQFLISKQFLKHFGLSLVVLFVLILLTFLSLSLYTRHGQSGEVPDFTGLSEDQFAQVIDNNDLRYLVIDSVHVKGVLPGVVVDQTPKAGARVKSNRTIFFTINAMTPEKVLMPRLIDYSSRNAQVMLESYGLKIGKLIYVPSEYANLVVGQHFQGKPVEPGTPLLRGAEVDLLIGKGLSDERTHLPDLTNLKVDEVRIYLQRVSLNLGIVAYDASVVTTADSMNAFVWKQSPVFSQGTKLQVGSSVDVWVTVDSSRVAAMTAPAVDEDEEVSF